MDVATEYRYSSTYLTDTAIDSVSDAYINTNADANPGVFRKLEVRNHTLTKIFIPVVTLYSYSCIDEEASVNMDAHVCLQFHIQMSVHTQTQM